jgi:two-component system response regulator PilR (NtrC family)
MARILVVDDEPSILSVMTTLLKAEGYEVVPESSGEKAKHLLGEQEFDLLLCDIYMKPVDGMEVLQFARDHRPALSVIMITAYGSVDTAVKALKLGAFDYVTKPFKVDELLITVQRALSYRAALTENANLKELLTTRYGLGSIVAESDAMKKVCDMVKRVAPTDATILIYGESGTGKELVAKAIHANSPRKDKRFLAVNCAALPEPLLESEMFGHVKGSFTGASADKEGLFEAAKGGTILLDEIGSMPLSIQAKLLRVLQEKEVRRVGSNNNVPVDARVLAAANVRLETLMEKGSFREDLFYRLSVIPVTVKPLRERTEDILPLAYHFLRQETKGRKSTPSLDGDVSRALESYPWPGNVRELENAIKHALAFAQGDRIVLSDLPAKIAEVKIAKTNGPALGSGTMEQTRGRSLKAFLRAKEKEYLDQVLKLTGGNKEEAAKALSISIATLYRKLPPSQETPPA